MAKECVGKVTHRRALKQKSNSVSIGPRSGDEIRT